MTRQGRALVTIGALVIAAAGGYALRAAASGAPGTGALTYAGVLEDPSGPVTGTHNVQVLLFDAPSAGSMLCQSPTAQVSVQDGHFAVQLPDACASAVAATSSAWVDVLVDGSDTGRTKIGAVPYAIEANHAVTASSAAPGTFAAPGNVTVGGDMAVGGVLSVGLHASTSCTFNAMSGFTDCACGANEIAIGGGAYSGAANVHLDESRNPSNPALGGNWRVGCQNAAGTRVQCVYPEAICARLAQ
jgi:hypothetical protein